MLPTVCIIHEFAHAIGPPANTRIKSHPTPFSEWSSL